MSNMVRARLLEKEELLSPYAARERLSKGRMISEESSGLRTEFQRDRDRIIHSNAFRRLKHKTQVFISPLGDHYVTRLTHTLEVSQIARTITRALNLNEDLVEAMTLGHDIGHTPFGHLGEEELNRIYSLGYHHADQGVRIVEKLEKKGLGLNLTQEVKDGIAAHSKPKDDLMGVHIDEEPLESQICRISDAVAYLNHDIEDAIRAGIISEHDIPRDCRLLLGQSHSQRINSMVNDIVECSWGATGLETGSDIKEVKIFMSTPVLEACNTLRGFMFEKVYSEAGKGDLPDCAREVLGMLYDQFSRHPERISGEYFIKEDSADRIAVDYISGMTDQFALQLAEEIRPGITGHIKQRFLM